MLRPSEPNKNDTGPAFGPQYTRECVKDHTQPGDGVHPNLEGTSPLWRAAWVHANPAQVYPWRWNTRPFSLSGAIHCRSRGGGPGKPLCSHRSADLFTVWPD